MRYLVIIEGGQPFLTEWFCCENNFRKDVDMTVYDLILNKYTTDGSTWLDIEIDYL